MDREIRWNIEWLRCPECGGDLFSEEEKLGCRSCNKTYPVRNGIPVFLKSFLKEEEEVEKEFWEEKYDSQEDGSFKTLSDSSYVRIINSFSIPEGGVGLEFACGSGAFSDFIRKSRMVGLDISFSLLDRARSVIPIQGSGENLPFRDGLFDFVLCAAALHHIPDLEKAIREIKRVLKNDGCVFIFELNANHPQRKLVSKRQSPWRKPFTATHFSPAENLIPEKVIMHSLEKNNFLIESVSYLSPRYRTWTLAGKTQELVSMALARGPLAKYIESYYLIRAKRIQ